MKVSVQGLELTLINVSINLSGGDVRVTEHFLDHPQVGPIAKKVSGEGVA